MNQVAFPHGGPLALHVAASLLAILALALAPPDEGAMLLLPLTGAAGHGLVARALAADARLVAAGRWPGSLIVYGTRRRLAGPMLGAGILVLRAGLPCGAEARS